MATQPPRPPTPRLTKRGAWYVCTPADLPALVAELNSRPNLHPWKPDQRTSMRPRELHRWYERAAGLGWVQPAAIVIDRLTPEGHWVRVEGEAARVLPILAPFVVAEPAQVEPAPPAAEQLALFGPAERGRAA